VFELLFYSQDGELRCQFTTEFGHEKINLLPGPASVEFSCAELSLLPGLYYLDATIKHRDAPGGDDIDWRYRCAMLRVDPGKMVRGEFYASHDWRVVEQRDPGNEISFQAHEVPM
jgi:hypothetical protein